MIELNVFDLNFNRIGEISKYNELVISRKYYEISELRLRIAPSPSVIELLQEGNILTTVSNPNYGYYIDVFDYTDENGTEIEIIAYSLNYFLSWRTIPKQQRTSGNVENVVKYFVNVNCISAENNRKIPNLRLASNSGISGTTESTHTGDTVLEHCLEICKANEMTVDVLMNHADKKYDVYTWRGEDRSTLQSVNPPVIFSKEFDNIISQKFTRSRVDWKNTVYVAGEGEDVNRKVVTVNNSNSGFNRRELYVDARDLQSKYTDENNNEITLTEAQYNNLLTQRGIEKQAENQIIETFESEVDMNTQFIFGIDYNLGDKVSVRNDEIQRVLHVRVVSAEITSNEQGVSLNVNFGESLPNLYQKIKKKVKA